MREKMAEGGKGTKSSTISVRLEPNLRYLTEIAARVQRRTLSSYVDWAVAESLSKIEILRSGKTIKDLADFLWDTNEVHRFLKLAFKLPHLLDHEEQVLWKSLQQNRYLWQGRRDPRGNFYWHPRVRTLILSRVEENWEALRAVARGTSKPDVLPKWEEVILPDGLYCSASPLEYYDEEADRGGTEPHDDEPSSEGADK